MAQARIHSSPFSPRNSPRVRRSDDSPSRQLQWDLERALSQVHLHEIESSKLHAHQKRQQQEELDALEAAQAHVHRIELSAADAQHEVVRKQAEAVLQAYIKKEEEVRRRREEEEQRRLEENDKRRKAEEEARKRVERDRKAREEKERRAQEERVRGEAELRAKAEAEAAEKARREKGALEQRQHEEKVRTDQEAAVEKQQEEAAKHAPAPQTSTSQPASQQAQAPSPDIERRHNSYLALHKKLKTFRSEFWTSTRTDPALKPHVGDMRRAMRTSVGQLTDDKVANRIAVRNSTRTSLHGLFEG